MFKKISKWNVWKKFKWNWITKPSQLKLFARVEGRRLHGAKITMYTVVKGAELYCYLKCRSNLIFLAFSTLANSTSRNFMNSFVDTFSFSALRKTFQEKKILYMRLKMLVFLISLHKQSWRRLFHINFQVTRKGKLCAEYTVNWPYSLSLTPIFVLCSNHPQHF